MAAIFQTFWNGFSSMKMYESLSKFCWSLFFEVQFTIFQHWFTWWIDADQATSHYLNQWYLVYPCIYASFGLNKLMWAMSFNEMKHNKHERDKIWTVRPRQNSWHFADQIFIFVCESCILLKLFAYVPIYTMPALAQVMVWATSTEQMAGYYLHQ